MKEPFRLICRRIRGGMFYCVDSTNQQRHCLEALHTTAGNPPISAGPGTGTLRQDVEIGGGRAHLGRCHQTAMAKISRMNQCIVPEIGG